MRGWLKDSAHPTTLARRTVHPWLADAYDRPAANPLGYLLFAPPMERGHHGQASLFLHAQTRATLKRKGSKFVVVRTEPRLKRWEKK